MGSIMLAGMQWRPVVQMVYWGDRPGGVRVSIHGSRYPYSVHPAVMRQLIVLSKRKWARKRKEIEPEEERERERKARKRKGVKGGGEK